MRRPAGGFPECAPISLVPCPVPLSPRPPSSGWIEIQPKLTAILETERRQRAAHAFTTKWQARRTQLRFHYDKFLKRARDGDLDKRTLPNFAGAVDLPCMKQLLTSDDPDADITRAQLVAIEGALRDEAESIRARLRAHLVRVMHVPPSPTRALALPSPSQQREEVQSSDVHPTEGSTPERHLESASSESDPELAQLNSAHAVFVCDWAHYEATTPCTATYSYWGLLEHWQAARSTVRWAPRARLSEHRKLVPRLLAALGLDEDATHTEVDELMRSGRPVCCCGVDPVPEFKTMPEIVVLGSLVCFFGCADVV